MKKRYVLRDLDRPSRFFACEKKSAIIVAEKTSYFSATRATNGQISLQTAIDAEKMADFSASPARQGTK